MSAFPLIPVELTNKATRQTQTLHTLYGNQSNGKVKKLHYENGGHKGVAMYQFHIDQPGEYEVELGRSDASPGDDVAFGTSIANGVVAGVLLIVGGVLMLLGGIIVLIVGLVLGRTPPRPPWPGQPVAWPASAPPAQAWPPPSGGQSPS